MDTTMSYVSKEDTPRVLKEIAEAVGDARRRLMRDVDWVNTVHSPSMTYRKFEVFIEEILSLIQTESPAQQRAKELRAQAEKLINEAIELEYVEVD